MNHPMTCRIVALGAALPAAALIALLLAAGSRCGAQDFDGAFTISPVSAPLLILDTLDNGSVDGSGVCLATPAAGMPRTWRITAKGDGT